MTNPTARAIFAAGLPTEAELLALLPSDLGGLTVLEHLQRMAEDAARYRWLRDADQCDSTLPYAELMCLAGESLDAAIDTLRK